jgi:hypothetical protein
MVAGSSIRAGSPCCSRERRASSAPALRMRVRSSVLSGAHGGRRVSRRRTPVAFTSSVPGLDTSRSVVGYHLILINRIKHSSRPRIGMTYMLKINPCRSTLLFGFDGETYRRDQLRLRWGAVSEPRQKP